MNKNLENKVSSSDLVCTETNKLYVEYIGGMQNQKLKSLLEFSKINPSSEIIKEGYISALKKYSSPRDEGKIDEFFNELGLDIPTLSNGEIQNLYYEMFKEDFFYEPTIKMNSLYRRTGISPDLPENEVQDFYANRLSGRYAFVNELIVMKNLTGISPKSLDENKLKLTFLEEASKGHSSYKYIKSLKELVGSKYVPSVDLIQKKHLELLLEGKDFNGDAKIYDSKILRECFGVFPSKEVLSKVFSHFVEKKDYEFIERLNESFDFSLDEIMRKGYLKMVQNTDWGYLETFKEVTGISPNFDNEFVQEKYSSLIEDGNFDGLGEFISFTEKPISEEVVQKGYRLFARERKLEEISDLKNISNVEPDKEVYEIFNESFVESVEESEKKSEKSFWDKFYFWKK